MIHFDISVNGQTITKFQAIRIDYETDSEGQKRPRYRWESWRPAAPSADAPYTRHCWGELTHHSMDDPEGLAAAILDAHDGVMAEAYVNARRAKLDRGEHFPIPPTDNEIEAALVEIHREKKVLQ